MEKKRTPATKTKETKKTPRPAKAFRKPIQAVRFERTVLGLLEQEKDKSFLRDCFELRDGSWSPKAGLDRAALVRLNKLAKAISANRGLIKPGPIIAAALLTSGTLAFGLGALNPALERAFEYGLQVAFGARAEIRSLRFSPFAARLSMASIAVADRDAPMTNLFETGRVVFHLDSATLLRGRYFIKEASVADIKLGTPRSASGALPEAETTQIAPKASKPESPPLVDFANFDAAALLERERAKLRSPLAFEAAGAAYADALTHWSDRAEKSKDSVSRLVASAKAAHEIKVAEIRSPLEAAAAIASVKTGIESARTVSDEAIAVSRGFSTELATAAALEKTAQAAVTADLAYLKAFVDPRSGAALSSLEPAVQMLLSSSAERYLYYGRKALDVAMKLKPAAPEESAKIDSKLAPKGRDVAFATQGQPRFRLGLLASSFTLDGKSWALELREVSSNPDLVPSPTSFEIRLQDGASHYTATGTADLREAGNPEFSVLADASAVPIDIGEELRSLGLASLEGSGKIAMMLKGAKSGDISASLDATIENPLARPLDGELGALVSKAIANAGEVRTSVAYLKKGGADVDIRVTGNLDSVLRDIFAELGARYAGEVASKIDAVMNTYIGEELAGKLSAKAGMDARLAAATSGEKSVASAQAALESKLMELEAKALALGAGTFKGITIPKLNP